MIQTVTKTWKELGGKLVFSFAVPQDPQAVSPAVAQIRYEGAAGTPVTISLPGQERVELGTLQFRDLAGKPLCQISGTLQRQVYRHGGAGGHVGVWGELAFGLLPPLSRVEGLLAWVPFDSESTPTPTPPPPLPDGSPAIVTE